MGHYEGTLTFEALDDGRRLKLLAPYGFVDDAGLAWRAPAGAIVDGASIPRLLWSASGGPLEGKYRNASVIHDYYCDVRIRDFHAVHRVFYEAMIASGESTTKAKGMYLAVRAAGPRWNETASHNTMLYGGHTPPPAGAVAPGLRVGDTARLAEHAVQGLAFETALATDFAPALGGALDHPTLDETTLEAAQAFIDRHDPPLEVIELVADRLWRGDPAAPAAAARPGGTAAYQAPPALA